MSRNALPWLRDMLHQATEDGSRSTALKPVGWMTGVLTSSSIGSAYFGAPSWLTMVFAVSSALSVALYVFAYLYLLFNDRDSLRSERYSLQKLAIEKGIVGDSSSGVIVIEIQVVPKALTTSASPEAEEGR